MKIYLDDPLTNVREHSMASTAISEGKKGMRFVKMFEEACAKHLGVEDTLATCSGTAALHLALLVMPVPDDLRVVVPSCTFPATANAVRHAEYEVLLADIDEDTWTLSGTDYGACIPVHLYGNPCYVYEPVVIDAAESFGSPILDSGRLHAYSFNNNKTITTFGGGLLAGPKEKIDEARHLAYQAQQAESDGFITDVGYNYRMSHVSAAIGLVQMSRLGKILDRKRNWNRIYRDELKGYVTFQEPTPGTEPSWWFTAALFPNRAEWTQAELRKKGVPTRRVFRPLHTMPPYKDDDKFPVAEKLWEFGLCLPSSPLNDEKGVRWVCEKIKEVIDSDS